MDIEIRRNRDLQLSFDFDEASAEALNKLIGDFPELTNEQRDVLDYGKRKRDEFEVEMWLYFEAHPTIDQLGNRITKETHEIGYDVDYEDWGNGVVMAVAKNIYVRPKKSEL